MRAAIWTTSLCRALMPSARAATFDCKKASTFAEKVVCSDSQLSAMDDELGRLYKGALAGTPNNETLKSDQKPGCLCAINAGIPIASRRPMPIASVLSRGPRRTQPKA